MFVVYLICNDPIVASINTCAVSIVLGSLLV